MADWFRSSRRRAGGDAAGQPFDAAGMVAADGERGAVRRRELLLAGAGGAVGLLAGWQLSTGPFPASGGGDPGKLYHDASKHGLGPLSGAIGGAAGGSQSRDPGGRIPLPVDFSDRGLSVEEAIEQRRSIRSYSRVPMTPAELSRLLHRADGITDPSTGFRAAPSAGALYPLEIHAFANNVEGVPRGIYRYDVRGHSLERVAAGDFRPRLLAAAIGQSVVVDAAVVLVLSAVFERTRQKYRERSYRYILMECGHVAQNVYLAATSMGLGACVVGAFLDDALNGLLGLDGEEEAALYLITVGHR